MRDARQSKPLKIPWTSYCVCRSRWLLKFAVSAARGRTLAQQVERTAAARFLFRWLVFPEIRARMKRGRTRSDTPDDLFGGPAGVFRRLKSLQFSLRARAMERPNGIQAPSLRLRMPSSLRSSFRFRSRSLSYTRQFSDTEAA